MTVEKILEQFDATKKNELGDSVKIGWLAEVEGRILYEILGRSPDEVTLPKRSADELILPEGFSRIYLLYLAAMTELCAENHSAYATLKGEFESQLSSYAKYLIRNR